MVYIEKALLISIHKGNWLLPPACVCVGGVYVSHNDIVSDPRYLSNLIGTQEFHLSAVGSLVSAVFLNEELSHLTG